MYRDPVPKNSWVFLTEGRGGKDTGYRIQKMLGLAACLLAGRVVELRPGPGSSRPKYLCCTLVPHLISLTGIVQVQPIQWLKNQSHASMKVRPCKWSQLD